MDFHMVELLYLILFFFIWSVKEIHEATLRVMTQPMGGGNLGRGEWQAW